MYPVICQLGPFRLYSYGLCIAISILLISTLLKKEIKVFGVQASVVYDLIFWTVISGILGGRLFYILLNFDYYRSIPLEMIMLHHGGLAWQGALLAGVLAGMVFIHKKGLPFWQFTDMVIPFVALGQSIGRVGCFLNGCCYGKPASFGVFFPVHGEVLHPTQVYMSVSQLLIFMILRSVYVKKVFLSGQIFALYLMLVALARFSVDFYRADHLVSLGGLSLTQAVSIAVGIFGIVLFVWRARYAKS